MVKPCIRAPHITSCLLSSTISRCSKLFYTISRCYFHIESTFSGASVSFVLSHIARYVPSPEENSCIPITHFQCKTHFEHLLKKQTTSFALRTVFNVNVRQLAVNERQCFLCGLWCAISVNGLVLLHESRALRLLHPVLLGRASHAVFYINPHCR